jgi:LysM repeat protein
MTVSADEPTESPRARDVDDVEPPRRGPRFDVADHGSGRSPSVGEVCPYLTSAAGAWRTVAPNRAHRCAALEPPGHVTTDKQRRHCLSVDHANCQIFRTARANRAAVLAPGLDPSAVAAADAARRPMARTAPLILEQPRLTAPAARWPLDRAFSQVALIGLLAVAFAAVVLTRLAAGGPTATPSPVASMAPSPTATATPTRRPTPAPSSAPSGSAGPSGVVPPPASGPAATAAPSVRTYRVEAGDTLVGIADEFGTTVKAIQDLNGLSSSDLRIGQLLQIP